MGFKKESTPSQQENRPVVSDPLQRSIIGKTIFIKGEISADEELLIEGKIEGNIKAKHRLIVGKNGQLNADIDAREVIIKGRVNGNVIASEKIEIVAEGVLIGNIVSPRVALAEGVVFKGNIDMATRAEREKKENPGSFLSSPKTINEPAGTTK